MDQKKITGTDIAYYVSIAAMIACVVGALLEILDGTNDFGMWLLFFLLEASCCRSTGKRRKQKGVKEDGKRESGE